MRSALFFVALAMLLISTHAWKHPSWKDIEDKARTHLNEAKTQLAALKQHLPTSMQHAINQAMGKLEQRHVQNDLHHAMETMERNLMSKWRNLAATEGLRIHDKKALEALMKHMVLSQARHNMERSTVMETYAHHLATHLMGQNRPVHEIKAFGASLSTLAHSYIRKFKEGAEAIMHKNGVNLNKEQLQKLLHTVGTEVMKGKDAMETLLAEMKKMGVNTADLDETVKNQLKSHFEALKTSGMAEMKKLMITHKVPVAIEKAIAAMKIKGMEMWEKMKAMHAARSKTAMDKLEALAKKAFKGMKTGDHKKIMMKLHLIIHPALNSHFHLIARIFKKHKMGTSHTVIHYTIYHRMKKEVEDDDHHHHRRWWHKKPVRLALIIGGSIFGVAVLVALIIVVVHMLKEKRRTPHRREIIGEEKSNLPYSVMDEKSASKA